MPRADFQIIENLFTEFALSNRAALQQQLIGQRAFAMVNMSHDAEIADELRVHNTQDFTTELTGKSSQTVSTVAAAHTDQLQPYHPPGS
jgi:hypothetical protein